MANKGQGNPANGDQCKMDFATILASSVHDLKNSVGMLLNNLHETASELVPGDSPLQEKFSQLQYDTMRVNNDLIQLLTIYKIDYDHYAMDISHHDVHDFLEEAMLHYSPLVEHKNVTMELDCPDDLFWFFDRNLIAGVINNVINNAIRYTRDKLALSATTTYDNMLQIRLEDNGPGYPDNMLVADPVEQKNIDIGSGSTGLGLYFAALVARQHKNHDSSGYIRITNGGRYGGGCFSIILP